MSDLFSNNASDVTTIQNALGFPRNTGYGVTVIGDSRMDQLMQDGGGTFWPANAAHNKSTHFLNWASAFTGASISIRGKYAVSGQRSDQYLTNLTSALASNASMYIIYGVVNDISQASTTGDTAATIAARIQSAATTIQRSGRIPILMTEPGANNFNANSVAMLHQYNQRMIEFVEQNPGMLIFDAASTLWDSTATSTSVITFKTGYSSDGVHYTNLGNYYLGKALSTYLTPYIQRYPDLSATSTFIPGNGNVGELVNPLFLTTTTSGLPTGFSGTIPTSYTLARGSTASVAASIITAPDGVGNGLKLTITGAAASESVSIKQDGVLANFATGDVVEGRVKIMVNSGGANLTQVCLSTNAGGDSVPFGDLTSANVTTQVLDSDIHGRQLSLRSVPYTLKSGFTWCSWNSKIIFGSSGGSADVTIWNPVLKRRFTF